MKAAGQNQNPVRPGGANPNVKWCEQPSKDGTKCEDKGQHQEQGSGLSKYITLNNAIAAVATLSFGIGFGMFAYIGAWAIDHKWGPASRRVNPEGDAASKPADDAITQVVSKPGNDVQPTAPQPDEPKPANDVQPPADAIEAQRAVDHAARVQRMAEKVKGYDAMWAIPDYDRTARAERYLRMYEEFRAKNRTTFMDGSDVDFPSDRWIQAIASTEAKEISRLAVQIKTADSNMADDTTLAKSTGIFDQWMAVPEMQREAMLHWDQNATALSLVEATSEKEIIEAAAKAARDGLAHERISEPQGGTLAESDYRRTLREYYINLDKAPDKEAFRRANPEPQRSEAAKAYVEYREQYRQRVNEVRRVWMAHPDVAPEKVRDKIVNCLKAETALGALVAKSAEGGAIHLPVEGVVVSPVWLSYALGNESFSMSAYAASAERRVARPASTADGRVILQVERDARGNLKVSESSRQDLKNTPWIKNLPEDARKATIEAIVDRALDVADSTVIKGAVALSMPELIGAVRERGVVVVDPSTGSAIPRTTVAPAPVPLAAAAVAPNSRPLPSFDLTADATQVDSLARQRAERAANGGDAAKSDVAGARGKKPKVNREEVTNMQGKIRRATRVAERTSRAVK